MLINIILKNKEVLRKKIQPKKKESKGMHFKQDWGGDKPSVLIIFLKKKNFFERKTKRGRGRYQQMNSLESTIHAEDGHKKAN